MQLLHVPSITFLLAAFVFQNFTAAVGVDLLLGRKDWPLGARQQGSLVSDFQAGPLPANTYSGSFVSDYSAQYTYDNLDESQDDPNPLLDAITYFFSTAPQNEQIQGSSEIVTYYVFWSEMYSGTATNPVSLNITLCTILESNGIEIFNEWTANVDSASAQSMAMDVYNVIDSSDQTIICGFPWVHNKGWAPAALMYVQDFGFNLGESPMPPATMNDLASLLASC